MSDRMGIIKEEDRKAITEVLKGLKGNVNVMVFHGKPCEYCDDTVAMVEELSAMDSRIKVTEYDIGTARKEAKFVGVDKVPAIVIGGKRMYGVVYYGIPAGYEFSSLLADMIDASSGSTGLSEATKKAARSITKPVNIKVFVTPTCPYCPKAVRTAHQLAIENPLIRAEMVEASEFMELSRQYGVMGVPKVVINDTVSFEGAQPEEAFMGYVMSAVGR